MNATATLTKREGEIAELIAWGATKKEVAGRLHISQRTTENHARHIYEKTGVTKANELSAWWFCHSFHISFDLSPIHKVIIAVFLLAIVVTDEMINTLETKYMLRVIRTESARKSGKRKDENTCNFLEFFNQ